MIMALRKRFDAPSETPTARRAEESEDTRPLLPQWCISFSLAVYNDYNTLVDNTNTMDV